VGISKEFPAERRRSLGPTSGGDGRNEDVDFRGQKRSNDTHASTTDPDARLSKKSHGGEARLSYMGHVLMENRNGLVVEHHLSISSGTAEPEAAVEMVKEIPVTTE